MRIRTMIGSSLAALLLTSAGLAQLSAQASTTEFTVTSATKTNHPYTGKGVEWGYVIDGVQGAELTLTRGVTYTFRINAPLHPFYLTADPAGGPSDKGEYAVGVTGSKTQKGVFTFTPGASTPSLLYYQCAAHPYMGWKIHILP